MLVDSGVTDVQQLVEKASLTTIAATRLICERNLAIEPSEDAEISPEYSLNLATSDDARGFRVLLRTEIDVTIGRIGCDVAAEYELEGLQLGRDSSGAMQEFVNNVALMHLLPFVRQSIADLTQRVFSAPLIMPMMQRGEMEFEIGLEDE